MKSLLRLTVALLLLTATLVPASADSIWGVTDNQFLVNWNPDSPGAFSVGTNISGLQNNEKILGLDFRPANNAFYAVGSSNRLYTISLNGVATQIGSAFASPLNGSNFGYDNSPDSDKSRIGTNTNKNYEVDPVTGAITEMSDMFFKAGDLNGGLDPNVVHLAHTNNTPNASTSELYGIDSGLDVLVAKNHLTGELTTVGFLGGNYTEVGGFDISGQTGMAYAALQPSGNTNSQFFVVDLVSGQATNVGEIGGGAVITALTITPTAAVPEPGSIGLLLGLFVAGSFRRRK